MDTPTPPRILLITVTFECDHRIIGMIAPEYADHLADIFHGESYTCLQCDPNGKQPRRVVAAHVQDEVGRTTGVMTSEHAARIAASFSEESHPVTAAPSATDNPPADVTGATPS